MQPNPIIFQNTSAPTADPNFGDDAALLRPTQSTLGDARILPFNRDYAAPDDRIPIRPDALVARFLRRGVPYNSLSRRRRVVYSACKRGTDIVVSSVLLALMLPVFVVIIILIKTTSRGTIFFTHRRLGQDGKEFGCLKFRTMVADAEDQLRRNAALQRQFEQTFKMKNDPRVTRLGAFLRCTSLDELPQLFQVLRGEMTLVGPRPIVRQELKKYGDCGEKLLSVKPGLSGLWQVCGRSDTTYPQRVSMDMYYIDHRCLSLDIKLLLLTGLAVLRKSGAC